MFSDSSVTPFLNHHKRLFGLSVTFFCISKCTEPFAKIQKQSWLENYFRRKGISLVVSSRFSWQNHRWKRGLIHKSITVGRGGISDDTHRRFRSKTTFFPGRVVKHWNRLFREVMESPSQEMSKTPSSSWRCAMLGWVWRYPGEGWTWRSRTPFPASMVLRFPVAKG